MTPAEIAVPDALLGGTLRLYQQPGGHRVGTDAVLLAAAAPRGATSIVDLGCGVGAVGLVAALATPNAHVRLVDNDPAALALAERNIVLNGLAERVSTALGDAFAPARERREAGLAPASADLVLTNPPFGAAESMRPSPDAARAAAHIMPPGGLGLWIGCAASLLKSRGVLTMIHRADALADILSALGEGFGGVRITPIHPRAGEAATRVILRVTKGAKTPLAILPGFILHGPDGRFTPEAEAIHRGEGRLPD